MFCATCNEHSLRRHTKIRCQQWHSAVSAAAAIATRRKPLCRAAATAATASLEAVAVELTWRSAAMRAVVAAAVVAVAAAAC